MSIYTDLMAYAIQCGDFHYDGTPRSTDNDFCVQPRILTQAEQDHEIYKADQLRRYALRKKAGNQRTYAARFATPEALENHKANARAYEKKKRDQARLQREALKAAATRVNGDASSGFFTQPNMRGMAGAAFRTAP